MRHALSLSILIAAAGFALAGCFGDSEPVSVAPDTGSSEAETWQVAVIPKGNSHEFWQSVKQGAEQAEAELGGIAVDFKGPAIENDPTQQKSLFELNVAKGVDAIAIAPVDGEALGSTIDQAAAGGMPIVVFDSGTSATATKSFIATDNYAAGRKAGEEMVRLLDGTGKIVVVRYKVGSTSTEKREQGFIDVIAEHDGITIVSDDQEGANREKQVAETLLSRFGDEIQGIYTPNESTTTGMMYAMRGGYYDKGIVHVGFDSTAEIVASIQQDEIKAVVVQDPVRMGYLTVQALHDLLSGEPVEAVIDTGSALVTKTSLEDPAIKALVGVE